MTTRFAILLTGHIRTWDKCRESFIANIIEPNYPIIPDIFVRTYDIKNSGSDKYFTEQEIKDMMVFTLKNGETVVPKSITIIKDAEYREEITREMEPLLGFEPPNGIYNLLSKVKTIHLCYETIKQYEAQNGFKYDIFIFSRFDVLYGGNVLLKDITNEDTAYLHYSNNPDPDETCVVALRKQADIYVSLYHELFKSRYEHNYSLGRVPSNDVHLLYKYSLLKHGYPDWSWSNNYTATICRQ